ncbi:hypothetical protein O999_01970 [Pseudomonas putida LF54]|nr:hypothetical protein O999_01970 [Pseudomonas putida LF54]
MAKLFSVNLNWKAVLSGFWSFLLWFAAMPCSQAWKLFQLVVRLKNTIRTFAYV